jgi:hypothetical protein
LMTSARGTPDLVRVLRSKQVFVPLLVLTLLVCHGLFCGMHQPLHVSAPTTAMEHSSHTAHGNGEGEQNLVLALFFPSFLMGHAVVDGVADGGSGVLSHTAALLLTVAAPFWSLLKDMQSWREAPLPRPSFRRPYPKATLRRPLAPAVPALQVFRR